MTDDERLTASLTVIRPGASGLELFWARRCDDREFLGGFHAFFAGSVEPIDAQLSVDDPFLSDADLRAAALRECFEESGLLITESGLVHRSSPDRDISSAVENESPLAISRLCPLGWWTTPDWLNPVFHTAFYAAVLTDREGDGLDDLNGDLDSGEFASGSWISPSEALRKWRRGRALTTTPIRLILEQLADTERPADIGAIDRLGRSRRESPTSATIEICAGVVLLPLETPTLPPATHTNAVIAGEKKFAIIDPGPSSTEALRPLLDHLQERDQRGDQCVGIVLTHHHPDHVGGVAELSRRLQVPVVAHPITLDRLGQVAQPARPLVDGNRIDIDHPGPLHAVHTPGHAPGHLALHQPDTDLFFAGDLVASRGTIVIDPPDGHMGSYLDSLRRIKTLSPRALIPAHGPPVTAPKKLLDHYLDHRQMREQKVLDALREHGPATATDLVSHVYADAPRAVWPLATRSLLAHLQHLEERDLASSRGELYSAR